MALGSSRARSLRAAAGPLCTADRERGTGNVTETDSVFTADALSSLSAAAEWWLPRAVICFSV